MPITFSLNADEEKKLNKWLENKAVQYTGAIGGRFTYSFHPTSVGVVVKVKDELNGEEIDLTDYHSW